MPPVGVPDLAADLLAARAAGRPTTLPTALDLGTAWQVSAEAERRLLALGRRPLGWKIGFTNRTIWPRYGVHQPIWGRVWDDTLTLLDGCEAHVSLAGLVEPRLEPEIVFGMAREPSPDMDESALAACIDWVAHGVEIVHTHVGWRFDGPAAPVADFGLHGRLLVGPRLRCSDFQAPAATLSALQLTLRHGHTVVDCGLGANVLDGPLSALRVWLQALREQTPSSRVRAGDCVTTGTLTDAWPVSPGQTWHTQPSDVRLAGLTIHFTV